MKRQELDAQKVWGYQQSAAATVYVYRCDLPIPPGLDPAQSPVRPLTVHQLVTALENVITDDGVRTIVFAASACNEVERDLPENGFGNTFWGWFQRSIPESSGWLWQRADAAREQFDPETCHIHERIVERPESADRSSSSTTRRRWYNSSGSGYISGASGGSYGCGGGSF